MKYDDDRYFDEEDNDLWDDELELTSDDNSAQPDDTSYDHSNNYFPYDAYASANGDSDDHDADEDNRDSGPQHDEPEDYYSEKEEVVSKKPRLFRKKDDEDEDNDFFDSDSEPAPQKKVKVPKLDPEDPDYWIEEEESPLSGIIPGPTGKWKWQLGLVVAIIALIIGAWIWFLRPYSDSAVKYGYIKNMERRGSLIKTFEGSMIPYKELGDPNPFYFEEVRFSVESDSLAAMMKRMMLGCVPVRVEYEMYHTPLLWKGEERMIITKVDTADPRKILPPEYR